jgi:hypothetical protein
MANNGFRYVPDVQVTLEPWRAHLGQHYDEVAAKLTDRDRSLEDYITGTGRPSPTAATLGDRVAFLLNPPACRVYHNANQSITDATETTVAFNSERYDTNTMHDTVTNNSRVTFNTAGVYVLTFCGLWPAAADYSLVYATFRLNGATVLDLDQRGTTAFSANHTMQLTTTYQFAAADYVEVRVYQDNTANTARNLTVSANYSPELTATWVGLGT